MIFSITKPRYIEKGFYKNGEPHNEDGVAIYYRNGICEYHLDGKLISKSETRSQEEEFKKIVKYRKLAAFK